MTNSPSSIPPSSNPPSSIPPFSIAIFASGTGSNAQKIIEHFRNHPSIRIALVVSNKATAGVLDKAAAAGIPTLLIDKERFFRGDGFVPELTTLGIDFIVLAGFLWKVPPSLIQAYPSRMINIHPALLPKYGGKGMYGNFVHEAVIAAGEKESGITIHYVDEQYDHGGTIFQATCPVFPEDTPETLANRIHALEHQHFPAVIESVILSKLVKNQPS
ncbi:MAG: phosphoribosylglycinamide formyltransferase [Flavihumibacter sp.]|nr:phosphoribosylglycinamide formyltransferase [Flavihumibacter sp.]